jgi:adenosylmethionine---8-amino-7-oxononanoate aminotransferase
MRQLHKGQKLLLRPIGNTIYAMPPYCMSDEKAVHLLAGTLAALDAVEISTEFIDVAVA